MKNVWLFQADPDEYELGKEIVPGARDDWKLSQLQKEVSEGDTAILWQAGQDAGIYGFGKLCGTPFEKHGEIRIYIEYTELFESPVLKADLLQSPGLSDMLILRMPHGKNPYRVKAKEFDALRPFIENARRPR